MANKHLATVGEALANIGAAIAECVRQDSQGNTPPVQHFEDCLGSEVGRLRALGEDGLAGAIEALRAPLRRLMTEGW